MSAVKKRILLVRNAQKDDFGGAETYQVSVSQTLSELGYIPTIVTASKKLQEHSAKQGVDYIPGIWWRRQNWSGLGTFTIPVYIAWQLILTLWYIKLLLQTKAGVIHLQSKDDFIAGSIAGYLLKRKVVWTDHMDLRYIFENIDKPFRNPVGKLVFFAARFSNHIILISQNEYNLVTGHFGNSIAIKSKVTIVNNGVIDRINELSSISTDESIFSFSIASRIVINKGIGEAIKAFHLLQENLNSSTAMRLDIYGDGHDLPMFKAMASANPDIFFHGHQSDAIKKIRSSNVFMLPSYQEGFSIALLEATMLGKAIIATDVDSNSEIIHDKVTGILVPVRNPEQLAKAMGILLTNESLKKSIEVNARKSFEDNFNLKTIVRKQIIPLYEN